MDDSAHDDEPRASLQRRRHVEPGAQFARRILCRRAAHSGREAHPALAESQPRLGGAYDLFGTGKTAIKGSIGRYPDVVRVSPANPVESCYSLTTNRTWNDTSLGVGDPRSGNFVP
jgi:hypothetical protein